MSNTSNQISELSPEERRALLAQILREKSKKSNLAFHGTCIHQLFEAQVEQRPDAVAVTFEDEQLTYWELNQRANQLAHHLRPLGVGPEVLVGICMERSLEMVVGLLGILKAGGAYVPLNPADPKVRLNFMLADSQVQVLLSQQRLLERLPRHSAQVICLDSDWEAIAQQSEENQISRATNKTLAYVIYSSTRGVLVAHHGVCNRLYWLQNTFPLSTSDAVLHKTSLEQDTAVWEILWPLVAGGRLVIAAAEGQDNPAYLRRVIAVQKVSILHFVPSALSAFLGSLSADSATQLSSLRLVLCSGEPLPRAVVDAFFKNFRCRLHNLYRLAEAAGEVTSHACQPFGTRDVLPVGHPTNISVYVLDKYLQLVPLGVIGEIYIGGSGLARGYLHASEKTVQRFVENSFSKTHGARLFKTGDLGRRLSDGTLELVGSISRQTWLGGFRVELEEVEAALLDEPLVEECMVLARETETSGSQLVAYVVSAGQLLPEQLQAHLQPLLPAYMLPCAYVLLSTLPRTTGGQVDEQALARLEVIDSDLVQRWEESLQSLPEIEQVAVVIQEKAERLPPVHLLDLLPDWKVTAARAVEELVMSPVRQGAEQDDSEPRVLAISDGGALIMEEDAPKTLTDALIQTATRYKDKGILYIQPDGSEVSQNYASLLLEAKCILAGLSRMGLKPNDTVILQLQALKDYFPTFWACILGGITPVTVTVAPAYEEKNSVVSKLFNTWELLNHPPILANDPLIESISGLRSFLPMEDLKVLSVSELRNHPPSSRIHQSYPNQVAFFQLTSGSTGIPKCIQETHHGIICHIHASKQFNGYQTEDVSLNWIPVDHVVPILTYHLKDVYLGCQQIQTQTDMILSNPLEWLNLIEKYRVTHTWSPNFGYKLVSNCLSKLQDRTWNLSSIKFFMNAGEQVTLPVVRDFLKLITPFNVPSHAIQPAFGMAEVCTCMTYQNHFDFETGVHRFKKSSLSGRLVKADRDDTNSVNFIDLGPPVPGVQIRIVDKDNQLLPEGVIGRLQIRGDVVTPGYFHNQAANHEAFLGNGWFNTGDLGFILEDHLTITGREKEIIIINGANYYCYEIEDIVNESDGVESTYVAACGIDDPGTGTEGLVIFFSPVVERIEENINLIKAIRTKVGSNLGISPTYVIPVAKQEFPKTTSGKIQREKLKKLLATGHFQDILKEIDIHLENANTLPDWFYQKIWKRMLPITHTTQLLTDSYLLFLDELGLGTFLCGELERLNRLCVGVEAGLDFAKLSPNRYSLAPGNADHYRLLLESLAADNFRIQQILHLWTYDEYAGEVSSLEALEQVQEQGIYSLLFLVQAQALVQGSEHPVRLQVISNHTQCISPADEIAYEKAPVLGLIKTIPQEMPWLTCRHIDLPVDRVEVNGIHILQEITVLQEEREVAYRNGQRLVPRLEKVDLLRQEKQELPFKIGGMYLISGGLGGIGVEIAKYLLKHYEARLLLVGRTLLPERSSWESHLEQSDLVSERIKAYLALEQVGGEFIYEAVDICDFDRLQQVLEQAKSRWQGTLDGVIHLAGVFQEHLLVEETRDSMSATLRSKVLGTWVLHQLLKNQPHGVFISFSSVYGFFGSFAGGAYAAANRFLDHFSHYQRYKGSLQSYCFSWSMWDELGLSRNYQQLQELIRARGYYVIQTEQGLYSFLVGLHHNQAHLLVGLDGSNQNLRRYMSSESYGIQKLTAYFTTGSSNGLSVIQLPELMVRDRFGIQSTCDFIKLQEMPLTNTGAIDQEKLVGGDVYRVSGERVAPVTEVERQIASIWQEVLGVPQVGIHDNFFDMGGNSLLAVQLMSQVREAFQVELPLNHLLNVPTVAGLAQVIEAVQQDGLSAIKTATTFINLDAEAVLDPTIVPDAAPEREPVKELAAILLTGATGFLGAFILHELLQQTQAEIYCLVRSPNAESGKQKIQSNLERYRVWDERLLDRIIPIPGDLSLPLLGLSSEEFQRLTTQIDVVYHNGAFVNFTYPYSKLKAANILGTQEVLRLASQTKVKPVHFVSTVAVFDSVDYANADVAREPDNLPSGEGVYGGYAQSKWVAEKLVMIARDRGLPVCIYRPGAITGHSETGAWNTDDAVCRIIRGVVQLGKMPNLSTMLEMVPVDYVAKAIVYLSQQPKFLGQVFHLVNPQSLPSSKVADWIRAYGYPLEQISYAKWQAELVQLSRSSGSNPLYPLLPLFFEQVFEGVTLFETLSQRPEFDCQNTLNGLAGTNIVCPSVKNLLGTYFSYLVRHSFLKKPQL